MLLRLRAPPPRHREGGQNAAGPMVCVFLCVLCNPASAVPAAAVVRAAIKSPNCFAKRMRLSDLCVHSGSPPYTAGCTRLLPARLCPPGAFTRTEFCRFAQQYVNARIRVNAGFHGIPNVA